MGSNAPVCEVCLNLGSELHKLLADRQGYSQCLGRLCTSAEAGCFTCALLVQAWQHYYPEVLDKPQLFRVEFFSLKPKGGKPRLSLSVWAKEIPDTDEDPLDEVEGGWGERFFHVDGMSGKPCPWEAVTPGPAMLTEIGDLVEQVKTWIQECEQDHEECRISPEVRLPSRVVQILGPWGDDTGAEAFKVRLLETDSARPGQYVCLSHCWGRHKIIETRSTNHERHMMEIPWCTLSTTFQDAIGFAYRLGVEYIWIDSLCIIQDSREDWEREAVRMADYYANAHVTLAATSAVDGTVGFFPKEKLTRRDEPLEMKGVDDNGGEYHVIMRTNINHPFEVQPEFEYNDYPLMTRGWVYQEHMLSRRFLHFGTRELVWECRSRTDCQCGMIHAIDTYWVNYGTNQAQSVVKHGKNWGGTNIEERRKLWQENVESIMGLNFTYAKDRLPAMAGVASRLAAGSQARYLAGLWEDCLIHDLCWVMTDHRGRRPAELRSLPSWSWGSVTGGLAWRGPADATERDMGITATVTNIDVEPSPPSFLGLLDRGTITVDAPTVTAHVRIIWHDLYSIRDVAFVFQDAQGQPVGSEQMGWFYFHPDDSSARTNIEDGAKVYVVKLMGWNSKTRMKSRKAVKRSAVFLVVQLQSPESHVYERIGFLQAYVSLHDGRDCFLEWFDRESGTRTMKLE